MRMIRIHRASVLIAGALLISALLPSAAFAATIAVDDFATVSEDSGATPIDVLANDSPSSGVTISDHSTSGHGTVVVAGDNLSLTYQPDSGYFGPDSFTYDATDGTDTAIATVDVTVTHVNHAPVAADDFKTVNEDSSATTINVLVNDHDPDSGDSISIQSASTSTHGTVVVAGNGLSLTYKPNALYNGTDSFTYTVTDGALTDSATVHMTVTHVDHPPVAVDDNQTVSEDSSATSINVLGNDTDADVGDTLTITGTSASTHGMVVIAGDAQSLTYQPDPLFHGTDSFTYTVSDGTLSDSATVHITVSHVDHQPSATDDFKTVSEDSNATSITVLLNDTDPDVGDLLTIANTSASSHGTVVIAGDSKSLTYKPNALFHGTDTFTYTVTDGLLTDSATVHMTVTHVNHAPVAVADPVTVLEDSSAATIDVLANDGDVDGDSLTISSTTPAVHGTVIVAGDSQSLTYQPNPLFHGTDSFTYTISDGALTDTATVTVTVTHVNHAPVAVDDALNIPQNAPNPVNAQVLLNDTDVDGDTLSIASPFCPTQGASNKGAVTPVGPIGAPTDCAYKPYPGTFGSDSFTYTMTDGTVTKTATVHVTITSGNHAPVAHNDSLSVPEGAGATALAILANDSDPDGNTLTITARTAASHGTVTITGGGSGLTYDPAGNYRGSDQFTYTISDGVLTDTATVLVTVVKDTSGPVVSGVTERFIGQTVGTSTTAVRLNWAGQDAGSGLASYLLQWSVNNAPYHTIKLPHATTNTIAVTLKAGVSYRFRVRATDREGNIGAFVYSPLMRPANAGETTAALTYIDPWWTTHTSKALGGATKAASNGSRRAILTFYGMDVSWVTTRYTSSGSAQVLIDGVLQSVINLKRSSTAYRQLVWAFHFASDGVHTIEIHPLGNGRVDIDGFVILK